MTVQALKDIELPSGIKVRAGAVLNVPDAIGAVLVNRGLARPRVQPGPIERKSERDISFVPGDPLPPAEPFVRVGTDPYPARSFEPGLYEDQDNFVRDLVTFTNPLWWWGWWPGWNDPTQTPPPAVTPSPSAGNRQSVLTLNEIKLQCHIEPDVPDEDELLLTYEMAARINTENYLRYQIDNTVGENIKQACLMLIAHWYRNREAVTTGKTSVGIEMPLGYKELLSSERDYPIY